MSVADWETPTYAAQKVSALLIGLRKEPPSRELALAITKLQEAHFWLEEWLLATAAPTQEVK